MTTGGIRGARGWATRSVAVLGPLALGCGSALAADPTAAPIEVTRLTSELVGLFVVATVMETALITLFNWRLYREFFNGRAVKTLVMFGFGWAVVSTFDYDVFHRLLGSLGTVGASGGLSKGLSALVLAGGSTTIHQLFLALGLRPPIETPAERVRQASDKGWISVRVVREGAVGDVAILVDAIVAPTPAQLEAPPLAGIVRERRFGQRLQSVFFAESLRWPPSGGHTVDVGTVYRVGVRATLPARTADGAVTIVERDLHIGRIAGGAVIDFVVTI